MEILLLRDGRTNGTGNIGLLGADGCWIAEFFNNAVVQKNVLTRGASAKSVGNKGNSGRGA